MQKTTIYRNPMSESLLEEEFTIVINFLGRPVLRSRFQYLFNSLKILIINRNGISLDMILTDDRKVLLIN